MKYNLVMHFGVMHKCVDQLLNVDVNQNSTHINTNTKSLDYLEESPKLVIDDCHEDSIEDEKIVNTTAPTAHPVISPKALFPCSLCPSCRKTKFRLFQHYCVAHFKRNLEDQFGLQFVTNNGCCPVCRKKMKNLYCFLIHMGAAHGEVARYLSQTKEISQVIKSKSPLINTWFCTSDECQKPSFPNKCSLMRHYALKHHSQKLTAVLQPKFADNGGICHDCGKLFSNYQQFMKHCSITHRLVLSCCNHTELASLKVQLGGRKGAGKRKVRKRREGGRLYECNLCSNTFFNNYLLKKHYTAKHFYDSLYADFTASISSGECEMCGQKHSGWRMVQHLGVTHNQVARYLGAD